jgi:putative ABC transport system permease protein
MNVLMSLTLRNLKLNKKRTIVTIIGIILSGAMICGVASLVYSFQDLFVESAKVMDGNYHATFFDVPYEDRGYILENANTESGMLTKHEGIAKLENAMDAMKPYISIQSYDKKAFQNMPVRLKEGRLPMKDGEIAVFEQLASEKSANWEIGQEITLPIGQRLDHGEVLSPDMPLSQTEIYEQQGEKTYTITGILEKSRFLSYSSPAYRAIAYLDGSKLEPEELVNISILLKKPWKVYKAVPEMAQAAGEIKYSYNNELLKWMGISKNENYRNMIFSVCLIVISLIAVGSVTVIYNAFAISVSERKKQFGMLSSVGATARQIRRTVYFEGFVLGLIGIPAGILSGILGIGATIKVINPLMQDTLANTGVALRLVISPMVIIVTIVFTGIIIMLSAFLPSKKASMISPIEAIRLTTDINIKGKKLRTSRLVRWLFGFEGELALKSLKRNRRRYRATVLSLFISIVLFVSFSTFMTYGFESTDIYYSDLPFDIRVYNFSAPENEVKEFLDETAKLEGIEEYVLPRRLYANAVETEPGKSRYKAFVEQYGMGQINSSDKVFIPFQISTMNKEAYDKYLKELGLEPSALSGTDRWKAILINKDKVQINQKYVEFKPIEASKGDILHLEELQYGEDHVPVDFDIEIAAVTDQFPFGFSYSNSINLIVSEEDFEAIQSIMKAENQEEGTYEDILIRSEKPDELEARIEELDNERFSGTSHIYNVSAAKKEMKRSKLVIAIFLYGFISLITLIGVTNIFNTISTNVALRRREFAMLKSVGMTPAGFSKMMRYESIFYGLKALLYGLPVSAAISLSMYNSFGNVFSFQFTLPWKSILICIIGVFLITFMTMIHAGRKLKNDNIVDSLKEENL